MPLISGILLAGFGGLTLYFNDKTFFYMKPTIINLMFALALLYGKLILKTSLLKKSSWRKLKVNRHWMEYSHRQMGLFFYFYCYRRCWRTQSEDLWVQFKVFGMIPITIVYTFFQISVIEKYKIEE